MSEYEIVKKAYHRNGIAGEGFMVAIANDEDGQKLVIQFREEGHTAVFDLNLLKNDVIEFGENSFRGDVVGSDIRAQLWEVEA